MVIPHENVKDLTDIPSNIKGQLEVKPVRWIDEVLDIALEYRPDPLEIDPEAEIGLSSVDEKSSKPQRLKH